MSDDFNGNLPVIVGAYVICGMVMALGWFLPLKKEIHLTGGNVPLTFYRHSPSTDEVQTFINNLINQSKKLLVQKYGQIDPDLPEETIFGQLYWLKNRNLISEEKYEELKEEYKRRKLCGN